MLAYVCSFQILNTPLKLAGGHRGLSSLPPLVGIVSMAAAFDSAGMTLGYEQA